MSKIIEQLVKYSSLSPWQFTHLILVGDHLVHDAHCVSGPDSLVTTTWHQQRGLGLLLAPVSVCLTREQHRHAYLRRAFSLWRQLDGCRPSLQAGPATLDEVITTLNIPDTSNDKLLTTLPHHDTVSGSEILTGYMDTNLQRLFMLSVRGQKIKPCNKNYYLSVFPQSRITGYTATLLQICGQASRKIG